MDMAKVKAARSYVNAVKTVRLLFISLLGIGICLMLLVSGIILFHLAILQYAPWPAETKMWFTMGCAVVYLTAAAVFFGFIFADRKWMRIFHANDFVDTVLREHYRSRL